MRVGALLLALLLFLSLGSFGVQGSGKKGGRGFQLISISGGSPSPSPQYYPYYTGSVGCTDCQGSSNDKLYARKLRFYNRMVDLYHSYKDCSSESGSNCGSLKSQYLTARRQYSYILGQPYSTAAKTVYYPVGYSSVGSSQAGGQTLIVAGGGGRSTGSGKKRGGGSSIVAIGGRGQGLYSDDNTFLQYR